MLSLSGIDDGPESEDAADHYEDGGRDNQEGGEEEGERVILETSQHVHAEEGACACAHRHAQAPHLHVEVQLHDAVSHLVL